MGFKKVVTHDCHSDVGVALINNCLNVSQEKLLHNLDEMPLTGMPDAVVSPDSGASKKSFEIAKNMKIPLIECIKHRDFETGKILNFDIPHHLFTKSIKRVIITDDIADGGGTFVGLSEKLFEHVDSVALYVTHGIFSKGKGVIQDSGIFVMCYHDWTTESRLLNTPINLEELL